MPIYEFECEHCGRFETLRRLSQSSEGSACPHCGTDSPRVFSAPRLAALSPSIRNAHERNERARHEPKQVQKNASAGDGKHHHGPGCNHGGHQLRASTGAGNRPWMLGH